MTRETLARARLIAWIIDGVIALGLINLFGPLGWPAAAVYWLLRDGLFDGQSIGMRVMGLKVIIQPTKIRCTFLQAAIRNVLWVIPIVQLITAVGALYYLRADKNHGRHWGDRLADTVVVKA